MKKSFSLLVLPLLSTLAVSAFATDHPTYVCETAPKAVPNDRFYISFTSDDEAMVKYERHAYQGSEEIAEVGTVEGCAPTQSASYSYRNVYVECAGDGDAGVITIEKRRDGSMDGTVRFPEGNIGYEMDTSLDVTCKQL